MTYRVKFYLNSATSIVEATLFNREESMEEMCNFLTETNFNSLIDGNGTAVIVNMKTVSKIEIEEVK